MGADHQTLLRQDDVGVHVVDFSGHRTGQQGAVHVDPARDVYLLEHGGLARGKLGTGPTPLPATEAQRGAGSCSTCQDQHQC